jgi:hypothetical protein
MPRRSIRDHGDVSGTAEVRRPKIVVDLFFEREEVRSSDVTRMARILVRSRSRDRCLQADLA